MTILLLSTSPIHCKGSMYSFSSSTPNLDPIDVSEVLFWMTGEWFYFLLILI